MSFFNISTLQQLQNQLLAADSQTVEAAFAQIGQITDLLALERLRAALVLVWQLNLDEGLQSQAQQLLRQKYPDLQPERLQAQFEIFRSVSSFLPWGGQDYTDLQRGNFARFREIKSDYDNLLSTSAVYSEFYLDLGRKLFMLFNLPLEAQQVFETILRYNPHNAEAHYSLGRILEKQTQPETALSHYQSCLAADPKHLYALLQAGDLSISLHQQHSEAVAFYLRAIELEPYSADIYQRIAQAYYHLEHYPQAKQYAEVALSINEHHEQALNLIGTIAWRVDKNVDKALEIYQKGLDNELHGDSALLLGSMAELHTESLQDYQKGRLYYQKSLRSQPLQPERLQKYVLLLTEHFQDINAASEAYEKYLALAPEDEATKEAYRQFQLKYLKQSPAVPEEDPLQALLDELAPYIDNGDDDDDEEVEADAASDSE